MIEPQRITLLNRVATRQGKYVLYWMQASQRTRYNHALEHAIRRANEHKLPLIVGFGLMDDYPEANLRHYAFMVQGLADVHAALQQRGIKFVVRHGSPPNVALVLARDAAWTVCDRGYLRHQKRWRNELADGAVCPVEQVESDVVVPVEVASQKAEFAARTIRPKILRFRNTYIKALRPVRPHKTSRRLKVATDTDIEVADPERALAQLKLDRTVSRVCHFEGGEKAAHRRLDEFMRTKLDSYKEGRREPSVDGTSTLSPYLHFGQISPVEIALRVQASDAPEADREAFLEELIVRRELAVNFVHYKPNYDQFDALPAWSRKTLLEHRNDRRNPVYSRRELESAQTYDVYWNAAQREMNATGFMHNALRMYWGKKILEWKRTPEEAFEEVLYLNNRQFLCGRDPASYANVAWIFGLHDRPWQERRVFGTVRYMNDSGLKRKFDMQAYIDRISQLEREHLADQSS